MKIIPAEGRQQPLRLKVRQHLASSLQTYESLVKNGGAHFWGNNKHVNAR
jgi:hypothetical protein